MMTAIGLILDNLDPDQVGALTYFMLNELLNGGSNYVYYFGLFDAFGNAISGTPTLNGLLWS